MENKRIAYPKYRKYQHLQLKDLLNSIDNDLHDLQEVCIEESDIKRLINLQDKFNEVLLRLD